jgi:hypothetical protein
VTTRSLGEVGIKLIGVYFGAAVLIRVFAVAASVAMPQSEGFPSAGSIAFLNAFAIIGQLVVSAACVFRGSQLARRIFADDPVQLVNVSRHEVLVVGIALLGISSIVAALPNILQFIGRAIWYAQGSLQSQFLPSMERSWQTLSTSVLELIVGSVLMLKAQKLASALDRRSSSSSERSREHAG